MMTYTPLPGGGFSIQFTPMFWDLCSLCWTAFMGLMIAWVFWTCKRWATAPTPGTGPANEGE